MPNVVRREPITAAMVEAIATLGHPVGDHGTVDVDGDPIDTTERYTIVWTVPGGQLDGSMAYPGEDGTLSYQVDSHGRSRAQSEWLADRTRDLLVNRQISPAGWSVMYVEVQALGDIEDEGVDDSGLPLFVCRERFSLSVTAA